MSDLLRPELGNPEQFRLRKSQHRTSEQYSLNFEAQAGRIP
jgi:hypothetical protein